MGTKLKTVSVRLDDQAGVRVSRAAQLVRQSKGAFLARAGEEAAQHVLLEWAAHQHEQGEASFSELAAETGLALEAIARCISDEKESEATKMYLTSARRLAEITGDRKFYARAKKAADAAKTIA